MTVFLPFPESHIVRTVQTGVLSTEIFGLPSILGLITSRLNFHKHLYTDLCVDIHFQLIWIDIEVCDC